MRRRPPLSALVLRSREAASRRTIQEAPEITGASFETRSCGALLRMRAQRQAAATRDTDGRMRT
jgi:hypothetical protein